MARQRYVGLVAPASDFDALRPYVDRLRALQGLCRPFSDDYKALDAAIHAVGAAAQHFTKLENFYGAHGDGSGTGSWARRRAETA